MRAKKSDYVRTKRGIGIVYDISNDTVYINEAKVSSNEVYTCTFDEIQCYGPDPIDVIKIGDWVNGKEIRHIDLSWEKYCNDLVAYVDDNKDGFISKYGTMITKEQLCQIAYVVEKDE